MKSGEATGGARALLVGCAAALALGAAGMAIIAGSGGAVSPPHRDAAVTALTAAEPGRPARAATAAGPRGRSAAAAPSTPVAPPAPAASADAAARAREEAVAQLEAQRSDVAARCLPRGGSGRVTLKLTFDASGREIARGVAEDRRAPSGELARCLRELPGTVLSVSPPGAAVALAIPLAFP